MGQCDPVTQREGILPAGLFEHRAEQGPSPLPVDASEGVVDQIGFGYIEKGGIDVSIFAPK